MDTSEPPRIKESYVKTYLAKSTLPDGAMKVEVVEIDLTVKVDGLRAATADSTHVASVEEAKDNYRRMQWLSTLSPIWLFLRRHIPSPETEQGRSLTTMDPELPTSRLLAPSADTLAAVKVFPLIPSLKKDILVRIFTKFVSSRVSHDSN